MLQLLPFAPLVLSLAGPASIPYCHDPRVQNSERCFAILDNGGQERDRLNIVYVDNASSYSNQRVGELVLGADRSTQNGSNDARPVATGHRKGLMKDGDRVCVTDHYLAWFDQSAGDGPDYDPRVYPNDFPRAGTLTGFWTLEPATKDFKYLRPSPTGQGLWAHNELIPGSASPDGGQFHWDPSSPPIEHSFAIPTTNDPDWAFYFFSYQNARLSPKSGWKVIADGVRSAQGVHYKTSSLVVSWKQKVDVVDGEDDLDIKNYVEASLEYICRPEDIVMVWKFRPAKADLLVNNIFIGLWLAYAQDNDGTSCDTNTGAQGWPDAVYGQPLYARSSQTLMPSWDQPRGVPAGQIARIRLAPYCQRRLDGTYPDYYNFFYYSVPAFAIGEGSVLDVGESSTLSPDLPAWRLTLLDTPLVGAGTEQDPVRIGYSDFGLWNEMFDGTLGFGPSSVNYVQIFRTGVWYQSAISIGTKLR